MFDYPPKRIINYGSSAHMLKINKYSIMSFNKYLHVNDSLIHMRKFIVAMCAFFGYCV